MTRLSIRRSRLSTTAACSLSKLLRMLIAIIFLHVVLLWSIIATGHFESPWQHNGLQESINIYGARGNNNDTDVIHGQDPSVQSSPKYPLVEVDVTTIGIASTITACGPNAFNDGAAVLKYSIDLTSRHGPKGGKYEYRFYIFYHPEAKSCAVPLQELGFEVLERHTPVNVSEIRGEAVRERITKNGCCGEKELIKLEAYRLIQHPVVIHLDLDVLVMHPMDAVIDLMLSPVSERVTTDVPLMWPEATIPDEISLVFTKDYNIVAPRRPDKPFQGGFFMIKPSLKTFQEFVDIILEGDFRDVNSGKGWGGKIGPFHGSMTIQGLLPWYYEYLHPNQAVELNRCVYNSMADNPTVAMSVNDTAEGRCRTNELKCEDCRTRNFDEIVLFHYTICFKPWTCSPQRQDKVEMRLCHRAHHEWFAYRSNLELSWGRNGTATSSFMTEHFLGHCTLPGSRGYTPIHEPYGKSTTSN